MSRSTRPSSTLLSLPVGVAAAAWNTSGMATRPRTRKIGRLSEIAQVAVRHGFGYFFERHKLTDILPWTSRDEGDPAASAIGSERGRLLREMLDELGPTFVKFGQLLSTRPDVVPPDIVAELRALQDDVRPFPFAQVREVIEAELGLTLEQAFLRFDEVPIAAASIGQVHRAMLPNGDEVAVKVQRPNAPRQIESDLALLYQVARMIKERVRALDFIDAHALVDEFARSIRQELDYKLEARHADNFRRDFADSELVVVPKVYWDYSSARMLTLEFLDGVQLVDLDLETTSLEERRELAYLVTQTWMEMIFEHGFFHGDPHPGNLLGLPGNRLGLLDFGLTKKIPDDFREAFKLTTRSMFTGDNEGLVRGLKAQGMKLKNEGDDASFIASGDFFRAMSDPETYKDKEIVQAVNEAWAEAFKKNPLVDMPGDMTLAMRVFFLLFGLGATVGSNLDLQENNIPQIALKYAQEPETIVHPPVTESPSAKIGVPANARSTAA